MVKKTSSKDFLAAYERMYQKGPQVKYTNSESAEGEMYSQVSNSNAY